MRHKIKIITDSTCDLPLELLKELDIEVLPLLVSIGGNTYQDLIEITPNKLFELVNETKETPKTSAISPLVFYTTFAKYVDQGYDVVYIGIGADLSSSYASAYTSANEFEGHVLVLDSKNLSSAIGLQLLKLVEYRDSNKSLSEIEQLMKQITPNVECSFALETMNYLHKGGRCSSLKYYFGKLLRIHPIIRMNEGKLKVHKTPRGKMIKALDEMIEEFKEQYVIGNIDLGKVMITHACTNEYASYIYQKLAEFMDPTAIIVTIAGCVISSHCGPNCIGILYIKK